MTQSVPVLFKKIRETSKVPTYATSGSACCDVYADVDEPVVIEPGFVKIIPTGLKLEVPDGYEVQVRSRSGLSTKNITLSNGIGTIDSDYRDEVGVILANHSIVPFIVKPGDRIAQLAICPTIKIEFVQKENLSSTERNGGFGSTGI